MAKEKNVMKITENNEHLLDVFSNDFYLELGTIGYDAINALLKKKPVDYSDLSYFDIVKKGIGSMNCASNELTSKLPFLHFNNMVSRNKGYQLVITYGLLLQRKGYKETFAPIILIPVKMHFDGDDITFQMVGKPFTNPYLKTERFEKRFDFYNNDKLMSILSLDKYIFNLVKHHTNNVRLENYLTFVEVKNPEVQLHHELFKLDNNLGSKLTSRYSVDGNNDNYTITPLDRTQRTAVAIASNGNSFALTGYNGTGKTNTLINIASDAMKRGKRVLYVSNNDNTLKTVYDTFEENNLEHMLSVFTKPFSSINERSHETKKGQILDQLLKDEILEKYNEISQYENLLTVKKKNYFMIDVMDNLVLSFPQTNLFSETIMKPAYRLYKHEVNEVLKALEIVDNNNDKIESFINSNFINIPITHQIKSAVEPMQLIEKIYINYCILREEKNILEKKYGFNTIKNYAHFRNQNLNYSRINKNDVPTSWYTQIKEDVEIKDAFPSFAKALRTLPKIKKEVEISNKLYTSIRERYDIENQQFDVKAAIKDITSDYFTMDDIKDIDNVLRDYRKISNEFEKAKEYCKELEVDFGKLKTRLDLNIKLSDTQLINEVLDFIYVFDKGYFSRAWCNYNNLETLYDKMSSIEKILDEYQECLEVYNKYFDNLENLDLNIAIIEKKNKEENSKYRGKLTSELLTKFNFIRQYIMKVPQMKKNYKDITYADYKYKVHISEVFRQFIDKLNAISDEKTRLHIEDAFLDLRGSGIVDLLSIAKAFRKAWLNVHVSYDFFDHYKLVEKADNAVEKVREIRTATLYFDKVVNWQNKMHMLLINHDYEVLFEAYQTLDTSSDYLTTMINKINGNENYKLLYEKHFKGEHTNTDELEILINNYQLYINLFTKAQSLVNTFEEKFNNEVIIHINNSEKVIQEIETLFQEYVKMFKTSVSKFYYDGFKTVISNFKVLLESREELETYLTITDQLKVLLKYKLYALNDYIVYNDKEKFKDRFKYSYFKNLYDEFISENPEFEKIKNYEKLLDNIMFLEKDLHDSNVEVIKISHTRGYRTGKARHMNYNQYVVKNTGSKMLFLTDTRTANLFLDMELFDLVLIDDAHLLHANEYYKVVDCKQVIIAGMEQLQTSVANNLLTRVRTTSIIPLKYRYLKTPLNLLTQYEDLKGRFYSEVEDNKGIKISKENYNSLILKLYRENNDNKINFFTSSYKKMHNIFQTIGNVLYDKGSSIYEISRYFNDNLNVSDLQTGYVIESDYNILDLSSYNHIDDEFISVSMIDALLSCKKELIIIDNNNILSKEDNSHFIQEVKKVVNHELPKFYVQKDSIVEKISRSLVRYRIKTIGTYLPINLVVEYENKYFGIVIFENPGSTEFSIMNEYREITSSDFPISIVWLSDLVNDFHKTIQRIVMEIRS